MGQLRQDQNSAPLELGGMAIKKGDQIIAQNGSRSAPLLRGTLMAKIVASGKWNPWTSATAITGEAMPRGIYVGEDILAATLVAGDVLNRDIIVGGAGLLIDKNMIVIENSLTLATTFVASSSSPYIETAEDILRQLGIFMKDAADINNFEN